MARVVKQFYDMSLKNKVFLFNAVVIVLSLFTLGFFATSISSQAIIDEAEKSSARELELINRNLDTMTSSYEDYIRVIASDYRLQEQLLQYEHSPEQVDASLKAQQLRSTLSEIMSNIISPNTQVISAAVLSQNHQVIYYSAINIYKLDAIFKTDFLNEVVLEQTPVWTSLFHLDFNDRSNIENTIAVSKLVIDKNLGEKTGIVVLFINEKNISKAYPDQGPNTHDKYYIVDANGMVISSQDKNDLYQSLDSVLDIGQEKYKQLTQQGKVIAKQDNKNILFSIQNFDKLDWKVVSVASLDEITSENSKIQSVILIVGMLCLVFAFIVSYAISHTITKPIHKLSRIMKGIMDGNMSIRVEPEIRGELGILTKGFNKLMDRIEGLLREVTTEQKTRREFEFMLIQSQIKPHFLYNSLETIISLNKLGRYDDAISTAKSLASFYRSSLSKGNDMIKISEEVDLTANYLAIQKMRYSKYMEHSIDIEDQIQDFEIPKLTLQPVVENSIYHGLKPREDKGRLEIKGYLSDGVICIEVYDNGVGIPPDKINSLLDESSFNGKSDDFGLASVNNRIKLHYGNQYGIRIQSEIGVYTKVTLTIPAVKGKDKI
jgi:two-component system sensor histidine kinase YesM